MSVARTVIHQPSFFAPLAVAASLGIAAASSWAASPWLQYGRDGQLQRDIRTGSQALAGSHHRGQASGRAHEHQSLRRHRRA